MLQLKPNLSPEMRQAIFEAQSALISAHADRNVELTAEIAVLKKRLAAYEAAELESKPIQFDSWQALARDLLQSIHHSDFAESYDGQKAIASWEQRVKELSA